MISRRGLIMAILAAGTATRTEAATGFHVTARFDATSTEQSEHMVNVGKAFAWIVNDAALWANIEPLIGSHVTITVRPE